MGIVLEPLTSVSPQLDEGFGDATNRNEANEVNQEGELSGTDPAQ